jgi:hypothetical protein
MKIAINDILTPKALLNSSPEMFKRPGVSVSNFNYSLNIFGGNSNLREPDLITEL